MTRTERLNAIVAKCRANLNYLDLCRKGGSHITKADLLAEAGWRATIVAIEGLREHDIPYNWAAELLDAIIAAWPAEPLGVDDD